MFPCYLQPCRRGTVNNPGGSARRFAVVLVPGSLRGALRKCVGGFSSRFGDLHFGIANCANTKESILKLLLLGQFETSHVFHTLRQNLTSKIVECPKSWRLPRCELDIWFAEMLPGLLIGHWQLSPFSPAKSTSHQPCPKLQCHFLHVFCLGVCLQPYGSLNIALRIHLKHSSYWCLVGTWRMIRKNM